MHDELNPKLPNRDVLNVGYIDTNDGGANRRGIYFGSDGALTQIACEGQRIAGSDKVYWMFDEPLLNAAGQVAFSGWLARYVDSRRSTGRRFCISTGGAITQVVRNGQAAPDGDGTFDIFSKPALNNSGQLAFVGRIENASTENGYSSGYFVGSGSSLTQIARWRQSVPDGNGRFTSPAAYPALNAAGQVAFFASLYDTAAGTNDDSGVFIGSGGPLSQVVREGQAAPDGDGTFVGLSREVTINDSGMAAFRGDIAGTGGEVDQGIFVGSKNSIAQIARTGQAAPDGNGTFAALDEPLLNKSGQVLFRSVLENTNGGTNDDTGCFLYSGGTITQLAREGQTAPDGNGLFQDFYELAMNTWGQVAFYGTLVGTNGGTDDDRGIFLAGESELIQIAREGMPLEGSTITSLAFRGNNIPAGDAGSGLNDHGHVAYYAGLANDGRVVALHVPEPSTLALLCLGAVALLAYGRRRRQ